MGNDERIGFFVFVFYGNVVDLNESDFLEYFVDDENIKVIVFYIEGVKDGRCFFNVFCYVLLKKFISF